MQIQLMVLRKSLEAIYQIVYGSDRTVTYDPQKRIGVMISKIGASKAISVGAYDFALAQLDA